MNKKLRCTVADAMQWWPDYSESDVLRLFGQRKFLDTREILDLEIPVNDRLWAVLRVELVPVLLLNEFACRETQALLVRERRAGREPDEQDWVDIRNRRRWLRKVELSDISASASTNLALRAVERSASMAMAWTAAVADRADAWDASKAASVRRLRRLLDNPPRWAVDNDEASDE